VYFRVGIPVLRQYFKKPIAVLNFVLLCFCGFAEYSSQRKAQGLFLKIPAWAGLSEVTSQE
jgi:hypothetical protein